MEEKAVVRSEVTSSALRQLAVGTLAGALAGLLAGVAAVLIQTETPTH